jgi:cysteine desulfurase
VNRSATIRLDNNATTAPCRDALEAAARWVAGNSANPGAAYGSAREAAAAIERAREQVAAAFGCDSVEVIFTSGGSEAVATAFHSELAAVRKRRARAPSGRGVPIIVTTAVEHSCVLENARLAGASGCRVVEVGVDRECRLDMAAFERALTPDVVLVSVMWVNNETGTVFPIERIAALAADRGIALHVDAVQAAGKVPVNLHALPGVKYASFSAHKFHGLKGAGLLYLRRGSRFVPLIPGGHQERGRRAGTENVAGIAAMGAAAAACCRTEAVGDAKRNGGKLRDRLEQALQHGAAGIAVVNAAGSERTWNTTSIAFPGVEAGELLRRLDARGVEASAGAACTTGSVEPSHVLRAMGFTAAAGKDAEARARGTIRLSLSWETTKREVDAAAKIILEEVAALRAAATPRRGSKRR